MKYFIQISNVEEISSIVSQNTSEFFNKANYWRYSEKGTTPINFPGLAKEKEKAAGPAGSRVSRANWRAICSPQQSVVTWFTCHSSDRVRSRPQQAWTISRPRRLPEEGVEAAAASRACVSFSQTPSAPSSPGCARGLPARPAEGRAGILGTTKERSSSSPGRPTPPPPSLPAASRARVPGRNQLPGPRFPGTRKGRGRCGHNWAGEAETRAQERQDAEGGEPGPCRRAIGRGRPAGRR